MASTEVDIGGGEIADALMISAMIVVFNEGGDLRFEIFREVVVFQKDAVL